VVTELRALLNQTAGDLESKSAQLESAESSSQTVSANEMLLKTALSEANALLQERTVACEELKEKLAARDMSVQVGFTLNNSLHCLC
jgi:hypothetical protein